MVTVRERPPSAAPPRRRPLRVQQPPATEALRPSQKRAEQRRASLERERSVELWLRRFSRL